MSRLLGDVSREHFPYPPATPEEIEEFERRVGWKLDPDLRAFYLHCNGAALLRWPDSPYEILPLSKIVRARVAICGEDDDRWGPASMYAFCYVRDSNYVVLDVSRQIDGRYPLSNRSRVWASDGPSVVVRQASRHKVMDQGLAEQRTSVL